MSWEPNEYAGQELTLCQGCGKKMYWDPAHAHRFCTYCGEAALIVACPRCAEPVNGASWFCGGCGAGLTVESQMQAAGWTPRMVEEAHMNLKELS